MELPDGVEPENLASVEVAGMLTAEAGGVHQLARDGGASAGEEKAQRAKQKCAPA